MAKIDPRTPVLVGAAQWKQRSEDPREAEEPLALMARCAELAAEDAGAPGLLTSLDSIRVPQGLWSYSNPGALLGERFGSLGAETVTGPISGNTVQLLLTDAVRQIAAGERDVVLLVGAESEHSKRRLKAQGLAPRRTPQKGSEPDRFIGDREYDYGRFEKHYRPRPISAFALYENAIRHQRGTSPAKHREVISALWSRFSKVAAGNPYAWVAEELSAEQIRTVSPDNRMVGYPYTKLLVANMVVDLAAALIVCSVEAARRHGIPEDRWIFPYAATDASAASHLTEKDAYFEEPAFGIGGLRALDLAGAEPAEIDHVDLYSCFPSAVQLSAAAIGFELSRELTVTGGLTFSGGPFNSYVMHSLATMVARLRAAPGKLGFVSSLGGYMRKHAFAVYGSEAPERGFQYADLTPDLAKQPQRAWLPEFSGSAEIESYTQLSEGEEAGSILACFLVPGGRAFATNRDAAVARAVAADEELCGQRARVSADSFEL